MRNLNVVFVHVTPAGHVHVLHLYYAKTLTRSLFSIQNTIQGHISCLKVSNDFLSLILISHGVVRSLSYKLKWEICQMLNKLEQY